MVAIAGGLFPTFIVIYVASYKPYRDVLIRIFKKVGVYTISKKSTIVIPATPTRNIKL